MDANSIRCNQYEIVRDGDDVAIRQVGADGRQNEIRITQDQLEVFFAHLRILVGGGA